jgi:hypothetical protein
LFNSPTGIVNYELRDALGYVVAPNISVIPDLIGNPEIFNTDAGFPLSRE